MITTEEFWDVDGTALNTYAWNISTQSGRLGTPEPRGENDLIPFRDGRLWRVKNVDQRVITLSMWVQGCLDDGSVPPPGTDQRQQFNANLQALNRLFYTASRRRLLDVTKRWRLPDGLRTATAQAEVAGGIDPEMTGNTRATYSVDLVLPDVYFFGETVTETIDTTNPTGRIVQNDGDDTVRRIEMRFQGPLTNPRVINRTPEPDVSVQVGTTVDSGSHLIVDVEEFTALVYDTPSGDLTANAIGGVTRSGSRWFMELLPGANEIDMEFGDGNGVLEMSYRIPYL